MRWLTSLLGRGKWWAYPNKKRGSIPNCFINSIFYSHQKTNTAWIIYYSLKLFLFEPTTQTIDYVQYASLDLCLKWKGFSYQPEG